MRLMVAAVAEVGTTTDFRRHKGSFELRAIWAKLRPEDPVRFGFVVFYGFFESIPDKGS